MTFKRDDYTVGWICAIHVELSAALEILDEEHQVPPTPRDDHNTYSCGRIGAHNVVITCLPDGRYGTVSAAVVAVRMQHSFPNLRLGLMVGIGGGAPSKANDIRLGDVVVSTPVNGVNGVIQYDFGKTIAEGKFMRTGSLNGPPAIVLGVLSAIRASNPKTVGNAIQATVRRVAESLGDDNRFRQPRQDADILYLADYEHVAGEETCEVCDPMQRATRVKRRYEYPYLFYGLIASGNQVMKHARTRDKIAKEEKVLCFEMEAAGLMNEFPCLVIRGICDYSDSHKNKGWQPYAALVAAAYAREFINRVPRSEEDVRFVLRRSDTIGKSKQSGTGTIKRINLMIPFQVPIPRNTAFTGRSEWLERMHVSFSTFESRQTPYRYAIIGTGGMGKTQVAIEYAYRYKKNYTAIFWIPSASEDTVRTAFIDIMQRIVDEQAKVTWPDSTPDYEMIAMKLDIPGLISGNGSVSSDPQKIDRIKKALFRWLQLPDNSRWLLIFDNADDIESFEPTNYFPEMGRGGILITTRRLEFSEVADHGDIDGLDQESATSLLLNLAGSPPNSEKDAIEVVEQLGYLPIAITQAGHFIREVKIPVKEYLSYYREAFMTVQSRKLSLSSSGGRSETAATTWEISFSKIEANSKAAAMMLLTCSYLNPTEIYQSLWEDDSASRMHQLELTFRVRQLASYSLVKRTASGVFSVHPVVSFWMRERLKLGERLRVVKSAISILGKAARRDNVSRKSSKWDGREERRLLAHLECLDLNLNADMLRAGQFEEEDDADEIWGYMHDIGSAFNNQEKYDKALRWLKAVLAGRQKTLGKNDLSTIETAELIAMVQHNQNEYEEAMKGYQKVLEVREKNLGSNHPLTLHTVHKIAITLHHQGNLDEAMSMYRKALAGYERTPKTEGLSILLAVSDIADVYHVQENYDEASRWYRRAHAGEVEILGRNHPTTLITVCLIARNLTGQKKYKDAIEWYERALNGSREVLGENHNMTIATLYNIASVYETQEDFEEAGEWYNRALRIQERSIGKSNAKTLKTVCSIARCFEGKKEYDDAIQWYKRALDNSPKGPSSHKTTAAISFSIATVYDIQTSYTEAEDWFLKSLTSREKFVGKDHPTTSTIAKAMAKSFQKRGMISDAIEWYERALSDRRHELGDEDDDSTAEISREIASLRGDEEEEDEEEEEVPEETEEVEAIEETVAEAPETAAEEKPIKPIQRRTTINERGVAGDKNELNKTHQSDAFATLKQGNEAEAKGELDTAMRCYRNALTRFERQLGKDNKNTLDAVNGIAKVLYKQEKYSEAAEFYDRSVTSRNDDTYSNPEPVTAYNIAIELNKEELWDQGMRWNEYALAGFEKAKGPSHEDTLDTLSRIAESFYKQNKRSEAAEWFERAIDSASEEDKSKYEPAAYMCYNTALSLQNKEQYDEAIRFYERARAKYEKDEGPKNWKTLDAVFKVAEVSQLKGKYDDAIKGYREAAIGRKEALGADHLDTIKATCGIAAIHDKQGQHAEAAEWYRKVIMESSRTDLVEEAKPSPATAYQLGNLLTKKRQGEKAVIWHKYAVTAFTKDQNERSRDALNATFSIGQALYSQRKYGDAAEWYEKAITKGTDFGDDYMPSASTSFFIALALKKQESWKQARRWFERTHSLNEKLYGKDNDNPKTLNAAFGSAQCSHELKDYRGAMKKYQRVYEARKKTLGEEHDDTIRTVYSIAKVFDLQNKNDESIEWYQKGIAVKKTLMGRNKPTHHRAYNMGNVLYNKKEYPQALEWYKHALELYEKEFPKDHSDVIDTVYRIGDCLYFGDKDADASEWYERGLKYRNKEFNTTTGWYIGSALEKKQEYDAARRWFERALIAYIKAYTEKDSRTLDVIFGIGQTYRLQGKYSEAVEWYQRALKGRIQVSGESNSNTIKAMYCLAKALDGSGKYGDAAENYEKALAKDASLISEYTPSDMAKFKLGNRLLEANKYEEANRYYRETYDGFEKEKGISDKQTLDTAWNIGLSFEKQSKYSEAADWYDRALTNAPESRKDEYKISGGSAYNIANALKNQKDYDRAMKHYGYAIGQYQKLYGAKDWRTLDAFFGMGQVHRFKSNYSKALDYYKKAYTGRIEALGEAKDDTIKAAYSVAAVLDLQGKRDEAVQWYQKAIKYDEKDISEGNQPDYVSTPYNLALALKKDKSWDKALRWFKYAFKRYDDTYGEEHAYTLDAAYQVGYCYDQLEDRKQAADWYKRTIAGRKKVLGEYHADTKAAIDMLKNLGRRRR